MAKYFALNNIVRGSEFRRKGKILIRILTLNDLSVGDSGIIFNVNISGALGTRLRDLGFVKGARIVALYKGSGITAYGICGTVIAVRDRDASSVEVMYE